MLPCECPCRQQRDYACRASIYGHRSRHQVFSSFLMFFIIKLSRRPLLVVVLSAALFPRMASGERSEAPTAAGASSFLFLVLLFLWLLPSSAAARTLLPMAIGERERSPHRSRRQQQQGPAQQHPVWRRGERSEAPPAESCSSAYLSLSFALSIISLSMKALLLECSCKI